MSQRTRKSDVAAARKNEGEALLAAIPPGAVLVALDERGSQWSTLELSERLQAWMQEGRDVAFIIGGPDGLSEDCRDRAEIQWSLGPATFPHALVRVMVAEQLYRAWSVTRNHPYHRA